MTQISFKDKKATLYVVSTPIGNLGDITYRAVEILKNVSCVYAEDTRTSAVLFARYEIKTPLESYHAFNESVKTEAVMIRLEEKEDVALISDAGTPGISDPGQDVITEAIRRGFHVVPIPGASAMLAALVSSGLVMQPFVFVGFLPKKMMEMKDRLKAYAGRRETLVVYESPKRISKTLPVMLDILGNRRIAICRELTKTYETIIRTTLTDAITLDHNDKGEYALVINGDETAQSFDHLSIREHVIKYIDAGDDEKDAMKKTALDRKIQKNEVYRAFKIEKD